MIGEEAAQLGRKAARRLSELGRFEIAPGLTDAEFDRIEQEYGFEFADDHRAFLAAGLPLNAPPKPGQTWSRPWPDWRHGDPNDLRRQLDWPIEGALFDVRVNGLWLPAWGRRPAAPEDAVESARSHLAQVPRLVPVYGHRYLPAGRGAYGHPVLSVYQTDIIFYGTEIADYIRHEFSGWHIPDDWTPPPLVAFWGDFLD